MKEVDLAQLTDVFPWKELYEDLGYAMHYPEVIMTSDRAYALYTQVSGILMMQSWEAGNKASYRLSRVESDHEAYRLDIDLQLLSIDEAWEVIGISEEALHIYMRLAILRYAIARDLSANSYREVDLGAGSYMLVAEALATT